jgi:hypothetical protein
MCGISRALQMSARMTENRGVPGPSPVSPFNSPLDPSLFIGNPSGLPHSLGRASVSSDVEPTPGWDDEQASARRLVAPAWLPHPFKSSGAELTTPIHARRKPVVDRDSGLPLVGA